MSLNQQLTEFRFNLETLDLLNTMGKTIEYSTQMLNELGFSSSLINFMQNNRMLLNSVLFVSNSIVNKILMSKKFVPI